MVGNVLRKVNSTFYVVHFGGDATGETAGRYRFVNNTVLAGESAVFRMFDAVESIEMHNNVFVRADGTGVNVIPTADVTWATGAEVIAGSNNWVEIGAFEHGGLFADGFESGGTGSWSATTP